MLHQLGNKPINRHAQWTAHTMHNNSINAQWTPHTMHNNTIIDNSTNSSCFNMLRPSLPVLVIEVMVRIPSPGPKVPMMSEEPSPSERRICNLTSKSCLRPLVPVIGSCTNSINSNKYNSINDPEALEPVRLDSRLDNRLDNIQCQQQRPSHLVSLGQDHGQEGQPLSLPGVRPCLAVSNLNILPL